MMYDGKVNGKKDVRQKDFMDAGKKTRETQKRDAMKSQKRNARKGSRG